MSEAKSPPKSPKESAVTMTELVLPSHTNVLGGAFGGVIMSWIDIAAAIAAGRHARKVVVTASIDALHFEASVQLGQVVTIQAMVNRAFNTSMEIGVRVDSEDQLTGKKVRNVHAYLTFVALDENRRPSSVPGLQPETDDEKRRYEEAKIRRDSRVRLAKEIKGRG